MSEKQWVQHISGQGEKWEVIDMGCIAFRCLNRKEATEVLLPKSEYRLCDPPEEWEDVTGECTITLLQGGFAAPVYRNTPIRISLGTRLIYRDGLHNGPHFLVERRKG